MTKAQNSFETTKTKSSNIFTWVYELITDNPTQSIATGLATILGLKHLGFLQYKTPSTTKTGKPGPESKNTEELEKVIRKIDQLLSKKKPGGVAKDEDDNNGFIPTDLGSEATAMPIGARPNMDREQSALFEAEEEPTRAMTITRNGDTITIALDDESITTTVAEFNILVTSHPELAAITISETDEIIIFSDGSVQQTAKSEEEVREDKEKDIAAQDGEEEEEESPANGDLRLDTDETDTAGSHSGPITELE
ncbi:MAG: hypothetical protein KBC27_01895 [Rickettsiales bacterium]|nr:hypothetical protein [Rickettsiales bacterium]